MKDEMGFGFLLYSRIFRSVAIIFMTLASPLYLSLAGFRVQEIGLVYLGLMLFNSAFCTISELNVERRKPSAIEKVNIIASTARVTATPTMLVCT